MRRVLEAGDELGLDWDRWADGRPWRLKRRRDLRGHPFPVAREAARNAAVNRGKVVQTVTYLGFLWVQFSDYRIRAGSPCPCGGREFDQLHRLFVRCRSCHALVELQRTSIFDDDEVEDERTTLLDEYTNIHLKYLEQSPDGDMYRGYGEEESGGPVLLFVEFARVTDVPGAQLTPENAGDRVHSLRAIPFEELVGVVDAHSVIDQDDWDLVL